MRQVDADVPRRPPMLFRRREIFRSVPAVESKQGLWGAEDRELAQLLARVFVFAAVAALTVPGGDERHHLGLGQAERSRMNAAEGVRVLETRRHKR